MKKLVSTIILGLIFCVVSAQAHRSSSAPAFIQNVTNCYLSAKGGIAWHNDVMFGNSDEGFTNLDYDIGWGAAAAIGFVVCDKWFFEAEAAFRRHNLDTVTLAPAGFPAITSPANGHIRDFTIMANAYYEHPLTCDWCVYLGAGVGISFNERESRDQPINEFTGNSDQLFAFQVMPGLAYHVNECITLTAGYRFFSTSKPSRTSNSVDKPVIHTIEFGLRYNFM